MTAPTPGIVISRRQAGLVRAAAISCRSSSAALARTARHASSSGSTTRATASFVPSRARAWVSNTRPAPFGTIRPKVFMTPRIWLESWIEMRSSWPRAPTSVRASIGAYPLTRTSR